MGPPASQVPDAAAFNNSDRKQSDNNWDVTALLRFEQSKHLDIEMGLAQKTRSPNLYERYTWSTWAMPAVMNNFVGDGNGYVGDPDLKPEVAHTASVTLDWHADDRSWAVKATPYLTEVEDYIDAVPVDQMPPFQANQFNVLRYSNQSARLYGIDISGNAQLARTDLGVWGLRAIISYTRGENRDTGDELYNIMPLNGRFAVTQKLGDWDNAIELELVDDKSDVSDVRNEIPTVGYGLLHLRASHAWETLRVDFGVENALDKFYVLPTGGAYTGQGSTMGINNIPWGIGVPGMGRSFFAAATWSF
jgi:iron complex outermembrane receptor protein